MQATILFPDHLGRHLRAARLKRGLTQAEVAAQLGISVQAMSRFERHAGRASFDRVHRLFLLLGFEIVMQTKAAEPVDQPVATSET